MIKFSGYDGTALGANPSAALVQGRDGSLYGTVISGGTYGQSSFGYGTVFKTTTDGALTTIVSFNGTNGANPGAGLVKGNDGNLYGTTEYGGTDTAGTVFKIIPPAAFVSLYSFNRVDGLNVVPLGLVQGADGFLYGTTYLGGVNGNGTVFRITTNGSFSTLAFFNGTNGANPEASLAQGDDGNFYGTTANGGTNGGWGTVFQITTNGLLTSLVSFNGTNGANPFSTLALGPDGLLYGTTSGGGDGYGTVFKVTKSGQLTILHNFEGSPVDGDGPDQVGLTQGSDGNFYGTTYAGGLNDAGTVFRIGRSGDYTNIYSFGDSLHGTQPGAGLVQGNDGNFYGTTSLGGTNDNGTLFKLTVPLSLPANQISSIRVAGSNVLVTIPSVSSEAYQLQYLTSLTTGTWIDVPGGSAISLGGPLTVTNFGGVSSQRFYRFTVTR